MIFFVFLEVVFSMMFGFFFCKYFMSVISVLWFIFLDLSIVLFLDFKNEDFMLLEKLDEFFDSDVFFLEMFNILFGGGIIVVLGSMMDGYMESMCVMFIWDVSKCFMVFL